MKDINYQIYSKIKKHSIPYINYQWSGYTWNKTHFGIDSYRDNDITVTIKIPHDTSKKIDIVLVERVFESCGNIGGFSARIETSQTSKKITKKDLFKRELESLELVKKAMNELKNL